MSVESLERAHREESRTPPMASTAHSGISNYTDMPPIPPKGTPAADLESDLKNKLHISQAMSGGKQKWSNGIESKGTGALKQGINAGGKQSYAGATKSPPKRILQKV